LDHEGSKGFYIIESAIKMYDMKLQYRGLRNRSILEIRKNLHVHQLLNL